MGQPAVRALKAEFVAKALTLVCQNVDPSKFGIDTQTGGDWFQVRMPRGFEYLFVAQLVYMAATPRPWWVPLLGADLSVSYIPDSHEVVMDFEGWRLV